METNTRWGKLVEKMGSEEAARLEMARRGAKSSRNKGKSGGFAALTPEERSEISKKANEARWGKRDSSNTRDNSDSGDGMGVSE